MSGLNAKAGDSKGTLAWAPSVIVDTAEQARGVSPVNAGRGIVASVPSRPSSNNAASRAFHWSFVFLRTPRGVGEVLDKESAGVIAHHRATSTEIFVCEEVLVD